VLLLPAPLLPVLFLPELFLPMLPLKASEFLMQVTNAILLYRAFFKM